MQQKTFIVLINGSNAIRRFHNMKKCYAYLLWYSDRISSHFAYVIYNGRGGVIEKDNL